MEHKTQEPTRLQSIGKAIVFVVVGIIAFNAVRDSFRPKPTTSDVEVSSLMSPSAIPPVEPEIYQKVMLGEELETGNFSVTVHKASITDVINTGNPYLNLIAEPDMEYLTIKATFENTGNVSRMLTDGDVTINYNGQDYKFDHTETVFARGWGAKHQRLNPLTTFTTRIVYKIPKEISGDAYYHPGRTHPDNKIFLGTIE